jgi:hypothetical protein
MNYIIKGVIIVVAIASMLVVGATTMIPLAQNTYASTSTCIPSTVGNQTATLTDDTCTATIPYSIVGSRADWREVIHIFQDQCTSIQGNFTNDDETSFTCTFPSTPPA